MGDSKKSIWSLKTTVVADTAPRKIRAAGPG